MKSFQDILNMCTIFLDGNLHRFKCGSCPFPFDVGTLNKGTQRKYGIHDVSWYSQHQFLYEDGVTFAEKRNAIYIYTHIYIYWWQKSKISCWSNIELYFFLSLKPYCPKTNSQHSTISCQQHLCTITYTSFSMTDVSSQLPRLLVPCGL